MHLTEQRGWFRFVTGEIFASRRKLVVEELKLWKPANILTVRLTRLGCNAHGSLLGKYYSFSMRLLSELGLGSQILSDWIQTSC